MPYFMVQHNITDPAFYKEHVEGMIDGLPSMDPINNGPPGEPEKGLHACGLHQMSINFPKSENGDVTVGWCTFEADDTWTAEKLKAKQDEEKKAWAVQDVWAINCPGAPSYFKK